MADNHLELSEPELKEAEERSSVTVRVVHEAVRREGEEELARSSSALAWSGLAAGLSMGFSLMVEGVLHAALPDTPWRPLISKLGYSIGFLIVILGRQQLFTENTLTVVLPVLRRPDSLMMRNVARLWAIVLAANLIGALLFACASARTDIFSHETRAAMTALSIDALSPAVGTVFLRGIVAGWLIALMVWLLPFAEAARVWVIILLTYVVGIGQFAHVIAGSVETMFAVAASQRSAWEYVSHFLVPALAGNIVGGVSLVAALAHAQV